MRLLGVDPNLVVPSSLQEARYLQQMEGGESVSNHQFERKSGCGKVCFNSKAQAKAACKRRLNKGANTSRLRVYYCEACNAHHMTSSFHQ